MNETKNLNEESILDLLNKKVDYLNNKEGDLNKELFDCPICKNKGFVFFLDKDEIKARSCKCIKTRNSIKNMLECGLDPELLKRYSLENYSTEELWQKKVKEKSLSFIEKCKSKENYWYLICGSTGEGKTHICTGIFKELIKEKVGRYIQFINLYQLLNKHLNYVNFDNNDMLDTKEKVKELIECDVLYIDDILKYCNDNLNQQLKVLYYILNCRYNNKKVTIISSEYNKQMLKEMDGSIYGRIYEMTNKGEYIISLKESEDRDIRLKKEE